ncbi:MAG: hypothetical protein IJ690_02060 [Clostridia bacterium]|nr:hypothetical protein [Clostridia bacterium]MBR1653726.1 hypothetical protein [Clostridia bacterium]
MDIELLKLTAICAIGGGIITDFIVQKIKEGVNLTNSKIFVWISLGVSLVFGTLFTRSFSDLSWLYCLWSGLFTWGGAEAIYQLLEEKLFTPFSQIQEEKKNKEKIIELPRKEDFK